MASISSPLLGPIVNINAQTVSRQVIAGGGGGRGVSAGRGGGGGTGTERGGAIIVRPQTSLVDRAQNLQIQQTQQSVGAISPALDIIRVNVRVLSDGINNLAKQLLLAGQVDQKNLKDQQESERKLNERQVRQGKENLLERRITAALAKPILSLQQKVGGLFDRIMGAMTTLFFGWLTNQGIETLKAYSAGDSKKLEEIKNSLIKNILFAVGTFAAVNVGFGLLMRTITGLTLKLAGLTARIALAPFRAAGGLIARIFGRTATTTAPAVARAGARVPVTGSVNLMTRLSNIGRGGGGAAARGAGNIGGRLLPGLNIALGGAATAYDLSQGKYGAAALSALSMVPGPIGWAGLGLRTAYGAATGEFGGKDKPTASPTASPTPAPSAATPAPTPTPTPTPAAVQPQTPAVSASSMTFGVDTNNTLPQISTPSESSTSQTSPYGMMNFEGLQQKLQEKPNETPAATIQAPPKPQTPVGTLPEAKPNIILTGGGGSKQQAPAPAASSEPISDVPLIASGNSDNFYVLYSQLNYNVVM